MRVARAFWIFTAASFAATAATALGQTRPDPSGSPGTSPSPLPASMMDPVAAEFQLSLIVWLSTLALAGLLSWAYFASKASDSSASDASNGRNGGAKTSSTPAAVTDKDLESSRISYGFWLIIAGFLITLAVVIVTMSHFRGANSTADVVAVVTAVTGVIGTLTAAFFGIQAAGAGRSQALSALSDQIKNGSSSTTVEYKLDPFAGPHAGNTRIAITGNGFTGASAVNFGSTPGVNPQFVNDGLIYITTPPLTLDPKAKSQEGLSDVAVTVVFPGAAQNKVVGKYYYYTVDVEKDTDGKPFVKVYGSGLAGASKVEFGNAGALPVEKADTDAVLQIPFNWNIPAKKDDAGKTVDPNNQDFWKDLLDKDVEVAIIYGSDPTPTKRMVIGKYRIPQYKDPDPTTPDPNAGSGSSGSSTSSSSTSSSSTPPSTTPASSTLADSTFAGSTPASSTFASTSSSSSLPGSSTDDGSDSGNSDQGNTTFGSSSSA